MPKDSSTAVHDLASLHAFIRQHAIKYHKIGVFDIDGVFRGKYVNRDKLESAIKKGFGFCDVVLGWDSADQLYNNSRVSGWHTGYRDAHVKLCLETTRRIPSEPHTLLILGQFTGDHARVCPRAILARVAQRARDLGYVAQGSAEYEFFMFSESPDSVRAKGYRNLTPMTPGMFGYSMIRNSVHHELYQELLEHMSTMDCEIEGLHTETGPGVLEAAIRYAPIEAAGDRGALFKTYTKVLAQRRQLMATFMAKWSNEYPGQSGHLHISLESTSDGRNLFHDPNSPDDMSGLLRHFVAGQVALLPELLPMVCSTTNAYRRLVPGMWAPTHANWGIENRTTAIRVIPSGGSTRSEYRIAPADANPHLAMAAALASGLWGIENKLELGPAVEGNGYENPGEGAVALAPDLERATEKFASSKAARELFGETFVEHYASTRRWETEQARARVTDYELARYFEII